MVHAASPNLAFSLEMASLSCCASNDDKAIYKPYVSMLSLLRVLYDG